MAALAAGAPAVVGVKARSRRVPVRVRALISYVVPSGVTDPDDSRMAPTAGSVIP